jgi:hypothetical protein
MPVEAEEVEREEEVEEKVGVIEPRRAVMMVEEGQPAVSGCIDRKATENHASPPHHPFAVVAAAAAACCWWC